MADVLQKDRVVEDEQISNDDEHVEESDEQNDDQEQDGVEGEEHKEDDTQDDSQDEPDYRSDEKAYLKENGIDAEDFDDFVKKHKASIEELEQLKKLGLTPKQQNNTEQGKDQNNKNQLFGRSHTSTTIENYVKNGRLSKPEDIAFYRGLAQVQDETLNPVLEKVESGIMEMYQAMRSMQTRMLDGEWIRLERRFGNVVKRETLDQILNQTNVFGNYIDVIKQMAVTDKRILAALNSNGSQPDKKNPFSRFSKQQRSTGGRSEGSNKFSKYLNESGELDDDKMSRAGLTSAQMSALGREYVAFVRKVKES